ncbi:MAG: hypothetical protein MI723_16435 [Caulobacterales bacterium]|nr:hypothetical protein [Caulobacterales bacterium]
MKNVTISLPEDLAQWARVEAANAGKSRSRWLADRERMRACATAPLTPDTHIAAHDIRRDTNYNCWDGLLLASARAAGCAYFLSEDLQHDRQVAGLRVIAPFRADRHDAFSD